MPSGELSMSPASSSLYDASPHTIVGSPHLRLGKFAFRDAKRLFRQHRPSPDSCTAPTMADNLVRPREQCCGQFKTNCLGRPQVDQRLVFGRSLNRKVSTRSTYPARTTDIRPATEIASATAAVAVQCEMCSSVRPLVSSPRIRTASAAITKAPAPSTNTPL
jgi:hypothetical protein